MNTCSGPKILENFSDVSGSFIPGNRMNTAFGPKQKKVIVVRVKLRNEEL
jgi:hypothetical protein